MSFSNKGLIVKRIKSNEFDSCILHSDNLGEFAIKVIEELCHRWNEAKIVHERPITKFS